MYDKLFWTENAVYNGLIDQFKKYKDTIHLKKMVSSNLVSTEFKLKAKGRIHHNEDEIMKSIYTLIYTIPLSYLFIILREKLDMDFSKTEKIFINTDYYNDYFVTGEAERLGINSESLVEIAMDLNIAKLLSESKMIHKQINNYSISIDEIRKKIPKTKNLSKKLKLQTINVEQTKQKMDLLQSVIKITEILKEVADLSEVPIKNMLQNSKYSKSYKDSYQLVLFDFKIFQYYYIINCLLLFIKIINYDFTDEEIKKLFGQLEINISYISTLYFFEIQNIIEYIYKKLKLLNNFDVQICIFEIMNINFLLSDIITNVLVDIRNDIINFIQIYKSSYLKYPLILRLSIFYKFILLWDSLAKLNSDESKKNLKRDNIRYKNNMNKVMNKVYSKNNLLNIKDISKHLNKLMYRICTYLYYDLKNNFELTTFEYGNIKPKNQFSEIDLEFKKERNLNNNNFLNTFIKAKEFSISKILDHLKKFYQDYFQIFSDAKKKLDNLEEEVPGGGKKKKNKKPQESETLIASKQSHSSPSESSPSSPSASSPSSASASASSPSSPSASSPYYPSTSSPSLSSASASSPSSPSTSSPSSATASKSSSSFASASKSSPSSATASKSSPSTATASKSSPSSASASSATKTFTIFNYTINKEKISKVDLFYRNIIKTSKVITLDSEKDIILFWNSNIRNRNLKKDLDLIRNKYFKYIQDNLDFDLYLILVTFLYSIYDISIISTEYLIFKSKVIDKIVNILLEIGINDEKLNNLLHNIYYILRKIYKELPIDKKKIFPKIVYYNFISDIANILYIKNLRDQFIVEKIYDQQVDINKLILEINLIDNISYWYNFYLPVILNTYIKKNADSELFKNLFLVKPIELYTTDFVCFYNIFIIYKYIDPELLTYPLFSNTENNIIPKLPINYSIEFKDYFERSSSLFGYKTNFDLYNETINEILPTNFQENENDATYDLQIPSVPTVTNEGTSIVTSTISNQDIIMNGIIQNLNKFIEVSPPWRITKENEFTDTNLITGSYNQRILKKRYIFVNDLLDDLYYNYFEIHVTGFLYYKDDITCGLVCHSTIYIDETYSELLYIFDIINENRTNKINIIKIHYGYEPIHHFKRNIWITFFNYSSNKNKPTLLFSFSLIDIRRRYPELETEFNTLFVVAKKIYYNFMKLVPELKCKHSENKRPIDSNFTYKKSNILSKMI
jgi:hypothetical protein